MKQSVLQSNLSLSVRADKGLSDLHMRRLISAGDIKSAIRILLEAKYGEGLNRESLSDYNYLINHEYETLIKDFDELYPDKNISNCFLYEYLYHNAKIFYKHRIQSENSESNINPKLLYCYKTEIGEHIYNKDYSNIPLRLKNVLESLDKQESLTPFDIDVSIDKAYYFDIADRLKDADKSIRKYFFVKIECINIITLYRSRLLELPFERVEGLLIKNDFMTDYKTVYFAPVNQWQDFYKDFDFQNIISILKEKKSVNDVFMEFEKVKDYYLMQIFKKNSDNPFKSDGIIFYYLNKLSQIKTVRTIMTYIANGMKKDKLEGIINANNG